MFLPVFQIERTPDYTKRHLTILTNLNKIKKFLVQVISLNLH